MKRTLEAEMHAMGVRARAAAVVLREASTGSKNKALLAAAKAIRADKDKILAANDEDMRASPASLSSSFAARILSLSARMALEAASKASFFDLVEASRSTTAATRARSPMACISASSVRAPVMEGVRFIGRL